MQGLPARRLAAALSPPAVVGRLVGVVGVNHEEGGVHALIAIDRHQERVTFHSSTPSQTQE
jgi:hypothetical protein